jgi:hypothetical protein
LPGCAPDAAFGWRRLAIISAIIGVLTTSKKVKQGVLSLSATAAPDRECC